MESINMGVWINKNKKRFVEKKVLILVDNNSLSTIEKIRNNLKYPSQIMYLPSDVKSFYSKKNLKNIVFCIRWCRRMYNTENVPVLNQFKYVENVNNKGYCRLLLEQGGVDIPKTYLHINAVKENNFYPCIVRPPLHCEGKLFFIANNESELNLIPYDTGWYASEVYPIENEYRAFVFDGEVKGVFKKPPNKTGKIQRNFYLNNVHWDRIDKPSNDLIDIAVKAVKILKLDFAGVNILESSKHEKKLVICEVNTKTSHHAHPDIINLYINYFNEKCKFFWNN